jgi:hypothetical protein
LRKKNNTNEDLMTKSMEKKSRWKRVKINGKEAMHIMTAGAMTSDSTRGSGGTDMLTRKGSEEPNISRNEKKICPEKRGG